MKVLKFGGTSVGSCRALEHVRDIVMSQNNPVIVVVSALGGMTDRLVELSQVDCMSPRISYTINSFRDRFESLISSLIGMCEQSDVMSEINALLKELEYTLHNAVHGLYFQDLIVSYGERLSSVFISRLFASKNVRLMSAFDLIYTTADRRSIDKDKSFRKIQESFKDNSGIDIYVIPGFVARAADGSVTNLGRGGSDLTAAVIARALNVSNIEIWTDVNGYMTADPRHDKNAVLIPSLSYEKALKMSSEGAKVVYAPAVGIMIDLRIPLQIRNTFDPDGRFTSVY